MRKDFILGSINSEEKWFLSQDGAWDGSLIEGVCCLLLGKLSCQGTLFLCMFVEGGGGGGGERRGWAEVDSLRVVVIRFRGAQFTL